MSKNIRNIREIRTEQITNTEQHEKARRQLNRDSVKFRENPCSSKNIRRIRSIRTEQKPLNFQHNEEVHQTNPVDPFDRPGDRSLGNADRLQRHPHRHHDLQQRQTR